MRYLFASSAFVVLAKSTDAHSIFHHHTKDTVTRFENIIYEQEKADFSSYVPNEEQFEFDDEISEDMMNGYVGSSGLFLSDKGKVTNNDPYTAALNSNVNEDSWILEAEDALLSDEVEIATFDPAPGFTGTGYIDYVGNGRDAFIEWTFEETGYFNLFFRYANGIGNRPLELSINDEWQKVIPTPFTGGWDVWDYTENFNVYLPPGTKRIRMSAYCCSGPNIDHLYIESAELSKSDMLGTIAKFESHIDGTLFLSKDEMFDELQIFFFNKKLLKENCVCLDAALELIETYEDIHGALFINSESRKGIERDWSTDDNLELERSMLYIQQTLIDEVYHYQLPYGDKSKLDPPLDNCEEKLTGRKWATSNYFPGYVDLPDDPSIEYSIQIDATMPEYWGMMACFADEPLLRPTGLYLSPGGIAEIEVSSDLVDSDYRIQVGASVNDNTNKNKHLRNDRVTSAYVIKGTKTFVGNPLGGGIYIKVPYLAALGVVTIKITGDVIQAPIFSMTSIRSTTGPEWNDNLRNSPAPWADVESDIFLMQVPTSWIKDYNYEHMQNLLQGNDDALTTVSELVGVPIEKRNKHVLYVQPDLHIKHGSYGVGYPQTNTLIQSGPDGPKGKPNHFLVKEPYLNWSTLWHELCHCIVRGENDYRGETEAIVNFPFTIVRNIHLGEDFDTSFARSFGYGRQDFTPDNAAVDWMVTVNFREGEEMDYSSTENDQFRYQERGYAKYADVVRLFSWQTFTDFNYKFNANYTNPIDNGLDVTDDRTLRLSIEAGKDLTPLIHFWGIHPVNEFDLRNKMIEYDLPLSGDVYDLLTRYLTLIPINNAEFNEFFDIVYPGSKQANCPNPLYGCGWYKEWAAIYDDSHGLKAVSAGNDVLNKYYSCEDSIEEFIINETSVTCADLLTENFDWACSHRQYTDLCPTSCGVCGDSISNPTKSPTNPPTKSSTNPTTSNPPTAIHFGGIFEAEDAFLSDEVKIADFEPAPGYTGSGYVDYDGDGADAYIEWTVNVPSGSEGEYMFSVRYALGWGSGSTRPCKLALDDVEDYADLPFYGTEEWDNWKYTKPIPMSLSIGTHTLRIYATGASGPNVDHILIQLPQPTVSPTYSPTDCQFDSTISRFLFAGQSNMVGVSNQADPTQFNDIIDILNPDESEDKEVIVENLKNKLFEAEAAVDTSCENMANILYDMRNFLTKKRMLIPSTDEGSVCSFTEGILPLDCERPVSSTACGASNDNFGPEFMFAHRFPKLTSPIQGQQISIAKVAVGGTRIFPRWAKENAQLEGNYWNELARAIKASKGTIEAFVWFQGENDTFDVDASNHYLGNLTQFVSDVRAEIFMYDDMDKFASVDNIPVVIVELGMWRYGTKVIDAQREYVKGDKNAILVSSGSSENVNERLSAYYHFDAASYLIIGDRIAKSLAAHLGEYHPTSSPAPSSSILTTPTPSSISPTTSTGTPSSTPTNTATNSCKKSSDRWMHIEIKTDKKVKIDKTKVTVYVKKKGKWRKVQGMSVSLKNHRNKRVALKPRCMNFKRCYKVELQEKKGAKFPGMKGYLKVNFDGKEDKKFGWKSGLKTSITVGRC